MNTSHPFAVARDSPASGPARDATGIPRWPRVGAIRSPASAARAALSGLALLLAAPVAAPADASAPALLQGHWVVRQVAVDRNDTIRRSAEPDDPRLMGAVLDIQADGTIAPSREDCTRAAWRAHGTATLGGLVARNVRESSGSRTRPSLADYGLAPVAGRLAVHVALCAAPAPAPGVPREPYDGGNWFASLSSDRMVEGNGVDTVLVYQRLNDQSPVEASFPCTGSLGDARRAVCRSQILAGLDRSVALAHERARRRVGGDAAAQQALEREQQAWAAERDRCNADEACLIEHMNDRIQALMQR